MLCFVMLQSIATHRDHFVPHNKKAVEALLGMHVSPVKHSYSWLPRKCNFWTDKQTDAGQSDSYVPLFFAGDTIARIYLYINYS